jgi:Rrf2 family protein
MGVQFNQATDYAFRVIMHLAALPEGVLANGQAISDQQSIPAGFLQKIMRSLSQGNLVKSYRGVDGGFALAKPAAEISLLDVIEVMEGPMDLQRCLKVDSTCSKGCDTKCPVHDSLATIQSDFTKALDKVNFARLVKENKEER